MTVLSLFDGISCGRVALERAGIAVDRYYASEIDKNAIKVTQTNYPDTIQVGDVRNLDTDSLPRIDLLIGGSPCTDFSTSGKQRGMSSAGIKIELMSIDQYLDLKEQGFAFTGQSYLFWEYVRILKAIKPKYFLLENVVMQDKWKNIITKVLGVEPVLINSALVSAQTRKRLYWTNIPDVSQPEDRHISLRDMLEDIPLDLNPGAIRGRPVSLNKGTIIGRRLDAGGHRKDNDKSVKIVQCLEVRKQNQDKSNCLTTAVKDNVLTPLPIGRHVDAYGMLSGKRLPFRYYTRKEYERLQTLPDDYTSCIAKDKAMKAIGNGWTVDVIAHILSNIKKGYDYGRQDEFCTDGMYKGI